MLFWYSETKRNLINYYRIPSVISVISSVISSSVSLGYFFGTFNPLTQANKVQMIGNFLNQTYLILWLIQEWSWLLKGHAVVFLLTSFLRRFFDNNTNSRKRIWSNFTHVLSSKCVRHVRKMKLLLRFLFTKKRVFKQRLHF